MSTSKKSDPKFEMAYDRAMLRSAFVSLFWGVISERKKEGGFTFQAFAKKIGSTKHEVSRWFNGDPNWTLNTVASIANALDLELNIEAVDRSKRVFKPSGIQTGTYSTPARTESKAAAQPYRLTRIANSSESRPPITSAR